MNEKLKEFLAMSKEEKKKFFAEKNLQPLTKEELDRFIKFEESIMSDMKETSSVKITANTKRKPKKSKS